MLYEVITVGFEAGARRNAVADRDHRAPLGEARAHRMILGKAIAQAVEALGDLFAGEAGQGLRALIDSYNFV